MKKSLYFLLPLAVGFALARLFGSAEHTVGADVPAAQPANPPHLVEAMMSAVRKPAPGEFPTPESVVRFLVEQVQKQDLDEATRAFPVTELYERSHFEAVAKFVGAFDASFPLPDAPYHNVIRAFGPITTFEVLSTDFAPAGELKMPEPCHSKLNIK